MPEPRRVEDAVLEILLDRLWQDGQLLDVLLSVWGAGEREGHVDGHNEARFTTSMAEEEV
jgi:hypothetical protein